MADSGVSVLVGIKLCETNTVTNQVCGYHVYSRASARGRDSDCLDSDAQYSEPVLYRYPLSNRFSWGLDISRLFPLQRRRGVADVSYFLQQHED